jgi:hypothetical protein
VRSCKIEDELLRETPRTAEIDIFHSSLKFEFSVSEEPFETFVFAEGLLVLDEKSDEVAMREAVVEGA